MGLLAGLTSSPASLIRSARKRIANGKLVHAGKELDRAIVRLQRGNGRKRNGGAEQLNEAWMLRGKVHLRAGELSEAFRALFAGRDRVGEDEDCLDFVVVAAVGLQSVPPQLYPVLMEFAGRPADWLAAGNRSGALLRIRHLLRPRLQEPATFGETARWNEAVCERNSACAWSRLHLAIVAAARGDWAAARAQAETSIRLGERSAAARNLHALALARAGQTKEAFQALAGEAESRNRGELLLRGHLAMRHGEWAEAERVLAIAHAAGPLVGDDRLARAEALMRVGKTDLARGLLEAVPTPAPPLARILSALSSIETRPVQAVMTLLQGLLDAKDTRAVAARAIVAAAAAKSDDLASARALAAIPADLRDEQHALVSGLCAVNLDQPAAASAAWSGLAARMPAVQRALDILRLNELARHLNAGRYVDVLSGWDVAASRAVSESGAPELRPHAVAGLLEAALAGAGQDGNAMTTPAELARIAAALQAAGLLESQPYGELLGSLAVIVDPTQSVPLSVRSLARPEAKLAAARLAIGRKDAVAARAWLDQLDLADPQQRPLLAATACLERDWVGALAALGSSGAGDLAALIQFLAGRPIAQDTAPGGAAAYFGAVTHLRAGNTDAGHALLARVEPDSRFRAPADHLLGWSHVALAGIALRAGELAAAREHLTASARLWPASAGGAIGGDCAEVDLLALHALADDRPAIAASLEARHSVQGPADARTCHNAWIFHVSQGQASVAAGNVDDAMGHWERAIGCFAVAVSDEAYLNDWLLERMAVYKVERPADLDLASELTAQFSAIIAAGSDRLEAAGDGEGSQRLRLLIPLLAAEVGAARLLAEQDGLEPASMPGRKLILGPTLLAETDLAEDLGRMSRFLGAADAVRRAAAEAEESEEAQLNDGDWLPGEALAYLFSSLRLPAILYQQKDHQRALDILERKQAICYPLCASQCGSGPLRGCPSRGRRFRQCNPAFAYDGGEKDLQAAARKLHAALATRVVETVLASDEPEVKELRARWRRALEIAKVAGNVEEVSERLKHTAQTRGKTLQAQEQTAKGVAFMERVLAAYDDDDLRVALGELKASSAIALVNSQSEFNRKDFESATATLREARQLSPRLSWIKLQLSAVLGVLASHVFDDDEKHGTRLYIEAVQVAAALLDESPHDPVYIEAAGNVSTRLSAIMMRDGVTAANERDDFGTAVDLLRIAWLLNPGSVVITRNLMTALHRRAADVAGFDKPVSGRLLQEALMIGRTLVNAGERDAELHQSIKRIDADFALLARHIGRAAATRLVAEPLSRVPPPDLSDALDRLRKRGLGQ